MINAFIREIQFADKKIFVEAMQRSVSLHQPWISAPCTDEQFDIYFERYQLPNQKSFVVCDEAGNIAGVFNISEIVQRLFQNAYLGFYAVADYAGKGYMSAGLKLILAKAFNDLNLHRIEANIQPGNTASIELVKKNGFRYEGYSPRYLKINHQWCGHEHWAITYEDFVMNDAAVLAKDHVEIVPHNAAWREQAETEINRVRAILPAKTVVDIQHIGSTAIPNIAAKPIIDIQIAARSLEEMKVIAVPALQKIGYEYWADNPDPERLFFVKGMPPFGEKRTHHIHIVEPTSKHWIGKIQFRDYLIAHPEVAKDYEQLKIKLAATHTFDREQYTDAKADFVNSILARINGG